MTREHLDRPPVLEDLTVVIPTLGRDVVEQALRAIASGEAWPAEVIVVDQGGREPIARWAEEMRRRGLKVRHVPVGSRGKSAGLNHGVRLTRTRFVAVTDDDCFPEPDWARRLVRRLRENPHVVLTGRVESVGDEANPAVSTSLEPDLQEKPRIRFDRLSGGNMGVAVEVYWRVGGFDEHPAVRYAEDPEWAYRALRAGVPILYAPEVVVAHLGWRSEPERETQYRKYARCHAAFFGKYLRRGDPLIAARAAVHFARALKGWLWWRLRRNAEEATRARAYAVEFFPGILEGWRGPGRPDVVRGTDGDGDGGGGGESA